MSELVNSEHLYLFHKALIIRPTTNNVCYIDICYVYVCIYIYIYIYICMYVCMHACMHDVCMFV